MPMGGCDPDLFADEIRTFIERASEARLQQETLRQQAAQFEVTSQRVRDDAPPAFDITPQAPSPSFEASAPSDAFDDAAASSDAAASTASSWADPFAWPSSPQTPASATSTPLITNVPLAVVAEDQDEASARLQREAEAIRAQLQDRAGLVGHFRSDAVARTHCNGRSFHGHGPSRSTRC